MKAQELIKKIKDIVEDALADNRPIMENQVHNGTERGSALFWKAAGICEIASDIDLLIIKEGETL